MKKKLFYTSPECDIIKMQIEGVVAASGGGFGGFHFDPIHPGEEEEEW